MSGRRESGLASVWRRSAVDQTLGVQPLLLWPARMQSRKTPVRQYCLSEQSGNTRGDRSESRSHATHAGRADARMRRQALASGNVGEPQVKSALGYILLRVRSLFGGVRPTTEESLHMHLWGLYHVTLILQKNVEQAEIRSREFDAPKDLDVIIGTSVHSSRLNEDLNQREYVANVQCVSRWNYILLNPQRVIRQTKQWCRSAK